jgi:uncharacterized protein YkwD
VVFSWVDIIRLLVIGLSAVAGWQRGFILSGLDLVRWVLSWLAGLLMYKFVAAALEYFTDLTETIRSPVAFLAIVVMTSILVQVGGWQLLKRIPREYHRAEVNRWLGLVPGLISGTVLAAILSALLFAMPFSDSVAAASQESLLADRFAIVTDEVENTLAPIFAPAIQQTLQRFRTVNTSSDDFIQLPFKVANSSPAPALEEQMLELLNKERVANGLTPLVMDRELIDVARAHSKDMFERGYFSHNSPEGKDAFQRMREAKVVFRAAGENLALSPTVQIAHTGLMNSPGHRANILSPNFGRVGIGIMNGGRRGLMVSQEFRN